MSNATLTNLGALIEQPDSRRRENGDNQTETRIYVASYDVCLAAQKTKNTAGTGDLLGYIIRTSSVEPVRGLAAKLVDVWAAGGNDADPESIPLPPDEFNLQSQDLSPVTEKCWSFRDVVVDQNFYNKEGLEGDGSAPEYKTLMSWVRQAGLLVDDVETNIAWKALYTIYTADPTNVEKAEAFVLADLLRRGITNFYLASFVYTWTQYSYTKPAISRGGIIESPSGPLGSDISALGLSCLRQADNLEWDGAKYRLTQSWLCGPNGHWESVLYPVIPIP